MATVRTSSSSSPALVIVKQVESETFAGFKTSSLEVGLVNSTGDAIVIPAGSTLYLTVTRVSKSAKDNASLMHCADLRVWTPTAGSATPVAEIEAPF